MSRYSRLLWACSASALIVLSSCKTTGSGGGGNRQANHRERLVEGQRCFLSGSYRKALRPLTEILDARGKSPWDGEAAYWAGFCHLRLGNYLDAEKRFSLAVEELTEPYLLGPGLVGLAESQHQQGKYRPAIAHYQRALAGYADFVDRTVVGQRVEAARRKSTDIGDAGIIVTKPPVEPVPGSVPGPAAGSGIPAGSYSLQVGAFAERDAAMALVRRVKGLGYAPYLQRLQRDGRFLYCVRVGIYRNKEQAAEVGKRLKASGIDSFVVP